MRQQAAAEQAKLKKQAEEDAVRRKLDKLDEEIRASNLEIERLEKLLDTYGPHS
jgi:hypothetical protein